jgi:hypothetical protein
VCRECGRCGVYLRVLVTTSCVTLNSIDRRKTTDKKGPKVSETESVRRTHALANNEVASTAQSEMVAVTTTDCAKHTEATHNDKEITISGF